MYSPCTPRILEYDLSNSVIADAMNSDPLGWAIRLTEVALTRRFKGTHKLEGYVNKNRDRD